VGVDDAAVQGPQPKTLAAVEAGAGQRHCPRCSAPSLLKVEGCDSCASCGYSRCS
jgi:ribonucleoside-diphosphate reductase alpha chain